MIKRIGTGYKPRKLQKLIHGCLKRFNVLVCHRRFGKTVLAVNEILHRALANPLRNPQYAYIAPTYKQAKKIAWQYFVDFTRNIPGVKVNKTELTIYIPRPGRVCPETGDKDSDVIKLMLIGADSPDDLRGIYLDGAILDEFAQCDPILWGQVIRPALADRKKTARDMGLFKDMSGNKLEPWAIFIGTPKGQNHFYHRYEKGRANEKYVKVYSENNDLVKEAHFARMIDHRLGIEEDTPDVELNHLLSTIPPEELGRYNKYRKFLVCNNWFTEVYKASETGILDREELDEMREDLSPEEVEQELECSFQAAVLGSYFGHRLNKLRDNERITSVPHDSRYPVDTYWDLGIGDKCTIWFVQKVGGMYRYIDYYESNGKGVDHYIRLLEAKEVLNGNTNIDEDMVEEIKGYGYKYGRHVWPHDGAAKDFITGVTRQESARSKGLNVEIQTRQSIEDRINASRDTLKNSWFDAEKCARGLDCLYNYQKEYDGKLMMFKNTPKHDWSSHGSDSFGYSSLDDRPTFFPNDPRRHRGKQRFADSEYNDLAA